MRGSMAFTSSSLHLSPAENDQATAPPEISIVLPFNCVIAPAPWWKYGWDSSRPSDDLNIVTLSGLSEVCGGSDGDKLEVGQGGMSDTTGTRRYQSRPPRPGLRSQRKEHPQTSRQRSPFNQWVTVTDGDDGLALFTSNGLPLLVEATPTTVNQTRRCTRAERDFGVCQSCVIPTRS
ncbi:hypothetical protein Bbelb_201820 [Branchiostoma belcheri]|nr:hypothetical protein Bbelb_201820 [Branchiostoma belcheri]